VISILFVATASQQANLKLCSVINQTLRATRTPREGHRWYVSLFAIHSLQRARPQLFR